MKTDGNEYHNGTGFVHSFVDDLPLVGKILAIYIVNDGTIVFKAHTYGTSYNKHFRSYVLHQLNSDITYFLYDHLVLKKPVHIRKPRSIPGQSVIVLPYHVNY